MQHEIQELSRWGQILVGAAVGVPIISAALVLYYNTACNWPTWKERLKGGLKVAEEEPLIAPVLNEVFGPGVLLPIPEVHSPEDVAKLPWKGNFSQDQDLFNVVDDYIQSEPDKAKRYEADRLVNFYGFGQELPEQMPADYES